MSVSSLNALRAVLPSHYRLWVRVALGIIVAGYVAATSGRWAHSGLEATVRGTELWTLLLVLGAVALELRGRTEPASYLAAGLVWAELFVSFLTSPAGVRMSSSPALPLLVLGTGLLFGARTAIVVTVASSILLPVSLTLSHHWLEIGPGIPARDFVYFFVLEVCLYGTTAVLLLYFRSLGQVVLQAERNAQRAAELVDDAPDAIVAASPDGRIEAFNREAERLLGVSRDSVLGKPNTKLPLHPFDEDARDQAALVMSDGTSEVIVGEGPTILEALARSRTREDGTQGRLFVLRDVTQKRASETRARELEHQLQHRQKLEALGQLAGGIAHDFNNLLTAMGGYASIARVPDNPAVREMCDQLQVAQQRGTALTRQLLAFARQEVVSPRPTRIDQIIEGLAKLMERLVGERITLDMDPECRGTILIDPGQLEQILINLAANARDAMPDGGTLYVGCQGSGTGKQAGLVVRDTGIGMDAETQRRMFEPFYTTKPRGRGTGLGLSTVHGIVAQSGGEVTVESAPGQGTTVRIVWPTCQPDSKTAVTTTLIANTSTRHGHILLAEDDDTVRGFVRRVLRRAGFEVSVASNGSEALAVASSLDAPPDLLLTDVIMPGLTGPQLGERFHRLAPDVPVLFMSGYLDEVLEGASFDLVEDLITKPFTARDLLARIDAKLSGRRWRSAAPGELHAALESSSPPHSAG